MCANLIGTRSLLRASRRGKEASATLLIYAANGKSLYRRSLRESAQRRQRYPIFGEPLIEDSEA
jgi:hypothetical protein